VPIVGQGKKENLNATRGELIKEDFKSGATGVAERAPTQMEPFLERGGKGRRQRVGWGGGVGCKWTNDANRWVNL